MAQLQIVPARRHNTHKKGFTLIEVLIFVSILSMVFVAAITISSVIIKDLKVNEHRIVATHYAEEVSEWLRSQKEIDWNAFTAHVPISPTQTTYCFNSNTFDWSNSTCGSTLNGIYSRTAAVTSLVDASNFQYQVNAVITVTWTELGNTYSVPITINYTVWE